MSVYFVYRSQYLTPMLNQVKVFEDATVLSWFQRIWNFGNDLGDSSAYDVELLGFEVYGFDSIFDAIAEHEIEPPKDESSLSQILREHLYVEGELDFSSNCIQVLTDDDELDVAYYIFDDVFLERNRDKAEFLLLSSFELPSDVKIESSESEFEVDARLKLIDTPGGGAGCLFFATMSEYDSGGNLSDLEGGWFIEGLRLPDLPEYLATTLPETGPAGYAPVELLLLRSQLFSDYSETRAGDLNLEALLSSPRSKMVWQQYLSSEADSDEAKTRILKSALKSCAQFPVCRVDYGFDWKFASGKLLSVSKDEVWEQIRTGEVTNDSTKSMVQVQAHVAQVSIHTDCWKLREPVDLYNRWILFDDIWALQYPELAQSILLYATRWDPLSGAVELRSSR